MNRLVALVYLGLVNMSLLQAQTHEGTEFWLGFMQHRDIGENSMVAMITSQYNTSGVVQMPRSNWERSFTLQANQVQLIQLPRAAETLGSESISRNGIRITTEHPSSVYIHQYFGFRSEATIVLPIASTGNNYFVMSYTGITSGGEDYYSQLLIVASKDSTVIDITPSTRTQRGRNENNTFSITLDAGETYQVQAATVNGDLTGTYLEANHHFAVFSGNEWTQVPRQCPLRDNLLEQMYPVNTWGRQFVSAPFIHNPYDIYRILASEDHTTIKVMIDDSEQVLIRNRGEFAEVRHGEPLLIQADKPVIVAKYIIGVQCTGYPIGDPSMVLLNSVSQTRDTLIFYSSRFQEIEENFVNVIVQSKDTTTVRLDGQSVLGRGSRFRMIGGEPEFAYTTLKVNSGSHTLTAAGCGLAAIVYGYGDAESYAYNGGANFNNINPQFLPQSACASDTFLLDPGLSPDRYTFDWDLGDGHIASTPSVKHAYEQAGTYTVALSIRDDCLNENSLVRQEIRVSPVDTLQTGIDQLLCEGESFSLEVSELNNALYTWRGPDQFESTTMLPIIDRAVPSMSGLYTVSALIDDCPAIPASINITVVPTPQPELGIDTFFCPDEGESILLDAGTYNAYSWDDQSELQSREVFEGGVYALEVTDMWGCMGNDTILIDARCPALLEMPNAFSPNGDQVNDVFEPMGQYILEIDLKIYDRWGQQIYTTRQLPGRWMGKNEQGSGAAEGVYFWTVEWEGFTQEGERIRKHQRGSVWLVR